MHKHVLIVYLRG